MKFFSTSYLIRPLRFYMILFFFSFPMTLQAISQSQILACLSKEETRLHENKKFKSALYLLNQNFVNRLILGDFPSLRPESIEIVCQSVTPSLSLLREILGKRELAFQDKKEIINELVREVFPFFQSYLLNLQTNLGPSENLSEMIPELKTFHQRFQYLQGQVDETLITSQNLLAQILFKLQSSTFKKWQ